jgi:hypothetical protein
MDKEPDRDDSTTMVWRLLGVMMLMWSFLVGGVFFWLGRMVQPLQPHRVRDTRQASTQTDPLAAHAVAAVVAGWQPEISDMTINSLRQELARRRLSVAGQKDKGPNRDPNK